MQNPRPVPGQRWVSDSEPELGLGIVLRAETRRVEIRFPAVGEQRLYSLPLSQLRRVAFRENDRIRLHDGLELVVVHVLEHDGLLMYRTADRTVHEGELADTISFSSPKDRLLAGQAGDLQTYALRVEALEHWSAMLGSPVRGYSGGRIDLIPHQLSIAVEVCSRLVPRVLLADEVGLGKTIEAGLILHRLHLTGRADRILILVPEPLIHQWFVEMLRRFNLSFSIFNEERCRSIEEHQPGTNPFLENQLVLCSIDLLARNHRRAAQVLEAGWNMVVVDEAHHLEWTQRSSGTAYKLVEALAARIPGVLMLTATPQQLGPEGHFARLRLLDPDRYVDLDTFLEETANYERVAKTVEHILDGQRLTDNDYAFFAGSSERIRHRSDELAAGVEGAGERLIADLLDSFGSGRVMFRNTRAALAGFPERKALLAPLPARPESDATGTKMKWLVDLLKDLGNEKVLLICSTRQMAEEIHKRLPLETSVKTALFHEGLTLIQRDRNAAYFAESDGARILVCSEIGSEGRNFQFAHHLVLFDLPVDPDVLEQRIGRLDRIGQKATVNIHVPYVPGTESEVLARWYHEGLNAFEENLHGAAEIARALESDLRPLLTTFDEEQLAALIDRSVVERAHITGKLAHGYDRLLALNSNRPERAAETARQIRAADADRSFERFFLRLLEYFGVYVEELDYRTYLFRPDYLLTDEFPSLPDDGMWVTFDRTRALNREDVNFMTGDHPFILNVMELLLKGEHGNASFGVWETAGDEMLLLEALLVVECIAPPGLHVDRFLNPRPVRVVVDQYLNDRTNDPLPGAAHLRNGDIHALLHEEGVTGDLLPAMLDAALDLATWKTEAIVGSAMNAMTAQLQREIERLEDLNQINSHVTLEEIAAAREQESALRAAIGTARPRIGGLRLILRRPKGK
ncbi:MAG: SNF2-related protein [Chlorobi bacterium]|nr:SNF2-related protein [Chlorobiota bacterium]